MIHSKPLTCLTWHDFAGTTVPATALLGMTTTPDNFAHQLDIIAQRYNVIDLDRLLAGDIPDRAALLTIDDSYASIARVAAPMLAARKLPAVLFVNPGPVARNQVPLDAVASQFCHRNSVERLAEVASAGAYTTPSFGAFLNDYVGPQGLAARADIKARLLAAMQTTEAELHKALGLFMTPAELAALPAQGIDVANHTLSHVHTGALDDRELAEEIAGARSLIEDITRRHVRAFAFPWGRQLDATPRVMAAIRSSGHEASFLVHGRNNVRRPAADLWYRLLLTNETGGRLNSALHFWPRLREWRARLG